MSIKSILNDKSTNLFNMLEETFQNQMLIAISAVDKQEKQTIDLAPSYGKDEEELEALKTSLDYAKDEMRCITCKCLRQGDRYSYCTEQCGDFIDNNELAIYNPRRFGCIHYEENKEDKKHV